ncbi:S-adenosylmethionine sensor upstream of mTORC1 [Linepithema humile]|uniref:S-adenosylmethionine sensor upstream of mTORC1 n=1 Tax=Linepithema humile TaxID=83485 RepID=UPI0006231208|nr:PREDICTED: probable methyltransferase BTM2 homolog [Linepithema humile]XP_012226202.1 PREDICTED: probable methyltransferase BTM2 homolog [Linepithema humile]
MATDEHKHLADIVKKTHALLRTECHQYGAKVAWERHVARNDVLQNYAASMQKLATKCWADNNSRNGTYCRMEWIKTQCKEYFFNGGKEKYDIRERDINTKMTLEKLSNENKMSENKQINVKNKLQNFQKQKISILDVGSCYNPLSIDPAFDVTAIDLISAVEGVFQCDFLNVAIEGETILSWDEREIHQLSANSFDAVVFSLLLEYLPCPKQRYVCCRNAYNVLKNSGILIIVSPDSKHVGANAKLMKSWRYTLSKLGFMRIKYEKLRHIHCLVFRKCVCKDVAMRWANLQHFSNDDKKYISEIEIFIPQDFQTICHKEKQEKLDEYNETDLLTLKSKRTIPFYI